MNKRLICIFLATYFSTSATLYSMEEFEYRSSNEHAQNSGNPLQKIDSGVSTSDPSLTSPQTDDSSSIESNDTEPSGGESPDSSTGSVVLVPTPDIQRRQAAVNLSNEVNYEASIASPTSETLRRLVPTCTRPNELTFYIRNALFEGEMYEYFDLSQRASRRTVKWDDKPLKKLFEQEEYQQLANTVLPGSDLKATPLAAAIMACSLDRIEVLLSLKDKEGKPLVNVNQAFDPNAYVLSNSSLIDKNTCAIIQAIRICKNYDGSKNPDGIEILKYLIKKAHATLNIKGLNFSTLQEAMMVGYKITKYLHKHGARTDVPGVVGKTMQEFISNERYRKEIDDETRSFITELLKQERSQNKKESRKTMAHPDVTELAPEEGQKVGELLHNKESRRTTLFHSLRAAIQNRFKHKKNGGTDEEV